MKIASIAPAPPNRCPVEAFVAETGIEPNANPIGQPALHAHRFRKPRGKTAAAKDTQHDLRRFELRVACADPLVSKDRLGLRAIHANHALTKIGEAGQ